MDIDGINYTRKYVEGALSLLPDAELKKVWDIMKIIMGNDDLEEAAYDLMVGERIANDPDCKESIPARQLMAELGITEEDLKDD